MNSDKKLSSRVVAVVAVLSLCVLCGVFFLSGCAGQTASAPDPSAEASSAGPAGTDAPSSSAGNEPDASAAAAGADESPTADAPAAADGGWSPDISFTTVDMSGNAWTDAAFAGHTLTVINLWAYWCGPCVGEMPDLQKLSQDYAPQGVQFLGLYDAYEEEDDAVTVQELGVTYPCLRYTADFDSYMNTGYIPVTIFVDGNGKVLGEAYIGSKSYSEWVSIIDGYLK